MTRTRRWSLLLATVAAVLLGAQSALACGGLVGPGGTVQLARTTTLAGYHDGVEHYLTSFTYAGGGAKFGSIVPLPGVPSDVRKGGEWTLQRLVRETQPQPELLRVPAAAVAGDAASHRAAQDEGRRSRHHRAARRRPGGRGLGPRGGFGLSVDAPEVLDFYAARSPIFMAASFDARRAEGRGQRLGDGTPIHLTIPTADPWCRCASSASATRRPTRSRPTCTCSPTAARPCCPTRSPPGSAGRPGAERPSVRAAPGRPARRQGHGLAAGLGHVAQLPASIPTAGELTHDLAVDASGRASPPRWRPAWPPAPAGGDGPARRRREPRVWRWWAWPAAALGVTAALAGLVLARERSFGPALSGAEREDTAGMGTTTPPDLEARLPRPAGPGRFDPAELDGLPEPVRRHLGLAIAPGTPLHTSACCGCEAASRSAA